ncbi:MAG: hypothetical protein QOF41_2112 [Methylobacteriaceae bacterium]|nr:hypothetical protein [Methylobacteriaceae bacterium]
MHVPQVPLAKSDAAMFVINSAGFEADILQLHVLEFFASKTDAEAKNDSDLIFGGVYLALREDGKRFVAEPSPIIPSYHSQCRIKLNPAADARDYTPELEKLAGDWLRQYSSLKRVPDDVGPNPELLPLADLLRLGLRLSRKRWPVF